MCQIKNVGDAPLRETFEQDWIFHAKINEHIYLVNMLFGFVPRGGDKQWKI